MTISSTEQKIKKVEVIIDKDPVSTSFEKWAKPGHFAKSLAKGPTTTTWIWNLHADAHDFDSHTSSLEEVSRKIFSAHFGQLAIIFLWLSGMYFHGAKFSNYVAWLSNPTSIKPSAQIVWPIVGQEILNGDVGGGFQGIQVTSGWFQLWRASGITTELELYSTAIGGLNPVTGGLWLSDTAHHHLALAVLFIIAGHMYRTNWGIGHSMQEILEAHKGPFTGQGRSQDMFSDTAIQLQPIFAQWVQNIHTLAPGNTTPNALATASYAFGGEVVSIGNKVAMMPISLGTADFMDSVSHVMDQEEAELVKYQDGTTVSADGTVAHITGGNFAQSAITINGWLRDFLWAQASQVIQSYGSALSAYGLIFLGWLHLQPKFKPGLAWFKNNESRLNHHLSGLFGVSSLAWTGHLVHIAIPESRGQHVGWNNFLSTPPHPAGLKPFFSGNWSAYAINPDTSQHIFGSQDGAGSAILTFLGGFHPQSQSLWLTDMAHHHLAIAVIFIVAGHMYRTNWKIGHNIKDILEAHEPPSGKLGRGHKGLYETITNSLHMQLGLALASLGVITSLVAQHMYAMPPYAFMARDFTTQAALYTHHQYIAGFLMVFIL
eukprot:IDg23907t1